MAQATAVSSASMIINREHVAGEDQFDVINPSTGEVYAQAPLCSRQQLDEAFDAARRAAPGWAATAIDERAAMLKLAADRISEASEDLAVILASELGKPLGAARAEVSGLIAYTRYFADQRLEDQIVIDDARERLVVTHEPVGVVSAITPWNGPLFMFALKTAPALLMGNTLVLKPSPETPIGTLRIGELIADIFPAGVLNVVSGPEPLGSWMVSHPVPRKVTFTGSIPVGKAIAQSAGADLKKLTLELGGNDAAIVLPDVDVDKVADDIFAAAFDNCGQACLALKRLYVVGDVYEAVVDALAQRASDAVVGNALDPSTRVGPLGTSHQRDHVQALIADARDRGARVVTGGNVIPGPGYFHELTIIADVEEGARVVDEEQFGPVLPIIRCSSVDDAVRRANGTMFGLGSSVWTADIPAAREIAARIEAGTVWINGHRNGSAVQRPLTGWKWSGLGVEKGRWGLESFVELKAVHEIRG